MHRHCTTVQPRGMKFLPCQVWPAGNFLGPALIGEALRESTCRICIIHVLSASPRMRYSGVRRRIRQSNCSTRPRWGPRARRFPYRFCRLRRLSPAADSKPIVHTFRLKILPDYCGAERLFYHLHSPHTSPLISFLATKFSPVTPPCSFFSLNLTS